jgi:hypothetical protein
MSETLTAPIGAILAAVTGKLVCPLDDLYDLQDFLAGRSLMTHERTVAFERQGGALLAQFPRLAEVEAPDFSVFPRDQVEAQCLAWVDSVAAHVGWTEAEVTFVEGCEVDPADAFDLMFGGRS